MFKLDRLAILMFLSYPGNLLEIRYQETFFAGALTRHVWSGIWVTDQCQQEILISDGLEFDCKWLEPLSYAYIPKVEALLLKTFENNYT